MNLEIEANEIRCLHSSFSSVFHILVNILLSLMNSNKTCTCITGQKGCTFLFISKITTLVRLLLKKN